MSQIEFKKVADTNKEYHSNSEYIGSTSLKKYGISPAHYLENKLCPTESTDAMISGSVYHTLILEPENFEKEVFVLNETLRPVPDKDYKTKENRDWKAGQMALNQDKYCIKSTDHEILLLMKTELQKNKFAWNLLHGEIEQSYYAILDGVKVKIRPDSFMPGKYKSDLKTCNDASLEAFKRHSFDMGYHISGSLYSDILDLIYEPEISEPFFFVAQEKTAPYSVAVYLASEQFLAQGRHCYSAYLSLHKKCLETGVYPGYEAYSQNEHGVFILDLPVWGLKEIPLII